MDNEFFTLHKMSTLTIEDSLLDGYFNNIKPFTILIGLIGFDISGVVNIN